RSAFDARPPGLAPPTQFDGSRAPRYCDHARRSTPGAGPRAVLGQVIDVEGSPATVALPDAPGRNLAVLGASAGDALAVLGAATMSVVADGDAVILAPLVADATDVAAAVAAHLPGEVDTIGIRDVRARVEELAAEVTARLAGGPRSPLYLVLFAADAADHVLDRPGTEALRRVLHFGPETGVHVLGWWRSVARLKTLLTLGAAPDDVGAWVALDVQGAELGALGTGAVAWAPRPGRGLFFDRTQHARPQVVIVPELDRGTP
ncbi:MAG: cell division protein FtsK, partial [Pseudonocardia sp.]